MAVVDNLVDESGAPIVLGEGSSIRPTGEVEASIGATSPSNWWFYGIVALAIVVALLLVLQWLNGAPGSDVQPGSPSAEPAVTTEP